MNINWTYFIDRLRAYPEGTHKILPPCPDYRIQAVEEQFNKMPEDLRAMLKHFNGAEIFIKTGPLASIFGITTIPPLPPSDWAPEWYIDRSTPKWRLSGSERTEWAIAMTNYGVLTLVDSKGNTKEWDTSQGKLSDRNLSFHDWVEDLLREGNIFLAES